MEKKPTIYVDNRENSVIVEQLVELGAEIKEKQLDIGDYILSDRVGVERKQIKDFLTSIMDGRIFDQAARLKAAYTRPVFIIEGPQELLFIETTNPNIVRGALAAIAIDFGIPILWSINQKETACLLYWIAFREQIAEKREPTIRHTKKILPLAKAQEFLIAGLPGISTLRARMLLKKFGTPRKIFAAKEKQLLKIPGFGQKRVKIIKEILDSKYSG
jgi:Fanconi anemia group M protein